MSDRLYAYIPKRGKKETKKIIVARIKQQFPEADISINGNEISIISKYYPMYIAPFYMDRSYWQIFVWRQWEYVYGDDDESISNRRFLRDICRILGSEDCWYQGEMLSDYVTEFDNDYDDIPFDMSKTLNKCIEYEESKGLPSWDYRKQPFIHDDFKDLN